jgi:dihydroorotase-like cyclic amidohydrolase
VPYIAFSDRDVSLGETRLKDYPPIRNESNRSLLVECLKLRLIDVVASGQSSTDPTYKLLDIGSFKNAVRGINVLGHSLKAVWSQFRPLLSTHKHENQLITLIFKWMARQPAQLIKANRGEIAVGRIADIVVWNPFAYGSHETCYTLHSETCVFKGKKLYGEIIKVFVAGRVRFHDGVHILT